MLWTWSFWKDAIERAIRAAAAAYGGILVVNNVPSLPGHINEWQSVLTAMGGAALASIMFSVAASGTTGSPNAAFVEIKGDIPPDKK